MRFQEAFPAGALAFGPEEEKPVILLLSFCSRPTLGLYFKYSIKSNFCKGTLTDSQGYLQLSFLAGNGASATYSDDIIVRFQDRQEHLARKRNRDLLKIFIPIPRFLIERYTGADDFRNPYLTASINLRGFNHIRSRSINFF